jgi:hypothetical protein
MVKTEKYEITFFESNADFEHTMKKHNLSVTELNSHLIKLGFQSYTKDGNFNFLQKPPSLSENEKEIVSMFNDGKSVDDILKVFNCTTYQIRQVIMKAGGSVYIGCSVDDLSPSQIRYVLNNNEKMNYTENAKDTHFSPFIVKSIVEERFEKFEFTTTLKKLFLTMLDNGITNPEIFKKELGIPYDVFDTEYNKYKSGDINLHGYSTRKVGIYNTILDVRMKMS